MKPDSMKGKCFRLKVKKRRLLTDQAEYFTGVIIELERYYITIVLFNA